jgi:hypothetical protein
MAKPEPKAKWRNRIVGHGEVDPNDLVANPRNWRIHPQAQQEALEGVLEDVGWVDTVLVNQRTGFVVDGHLRVQLALRRDEQKVPVTYLDLSEDEELEVLASYDPLSAMAVQDIEKFNELAALVHPSADAVSRLMDGVQQSNIRTLSEGLQRPDFRGVVEQMGAAPENIMKDAADGNWLYIEYYGDKETFDEVRELLANAMRGASPHEIDPGFFLQMVREYIGGRR